MSEAAEEIRRQAIALVNALRSGELFGYAIHHIPELTADEVVRRAFSYRPIQL
jgi:hypothetical protein